MQYVIKRALLALASDIIKAWPTHFVLSEGQHCFCVTTFDASTASSAVPRLLILEHVRVPVHCLDTIDHSGLDAVFLWPEGSRTWLRVLVQPEFSRAGDHGVAVVCGARKRQLPVDSMHSMCSMHTGLGHACPCDCLPVCTVYLFGLCSKKGVSFAGRTALEGNKAGKEMFDKGELAAILRFGAANLFEEDKNAIAKQEVHDRDEKLYNESIEAILARAEVVDSRIQV
jgi:hypothetical protein